MLLHEIFEAAQPKKPSLLIVVHPGSACGSATFNLGKFEARAARDYLAHDINKWDESILIVDGELSDELPDYPLLDSAIKNALSKAKTSGHGSGRIYACAMNTPNWSNLVLQAVEKLQVDKSAYVGLTGAWFSHTKDDGCVNHVYNTLQSAGYTFIDVHDSAVVEPNNDEDPDEEYEDA